MSARRRFTRRTAALLATLMIASAVLPGVVSAIPGGDGLGPRAESYTEPSAQIGESSGPAPTVVRTVVKEEAVRVLPIVLASAALLIAIGGTAFALTHGTPERHGIRGLRGQH